MTSALGGVSGQQHAPAAFYTPERPGTQFTRGWVGPSAGLDGGKSRSYWDWIPYRPTRSQSLYRQSYRIAALLNKGISVQTVYNPVYS